MYIWSWKKVSVWYLLTKKIPGVWTIMVRTILFWIWGPKWSPYDAETVWPSTIYKLYKVYKTYENWCISSKSTKTMFGIKKRGKQINWTSIFEIMKTWFLLFLVQTGGWDGLWRIQETKLVCAISRKIIWGWKI